MQPSLLFHIPITALLLLRLFRFTRICSRMKQNRYLAESARVMESGGIAFFTFFIHDEQTQLPRNFDFPVKLRRLRINGRAGEQSECAV
jgi:hypothetical protein